jgi:5-methyltetrahydrofolate--homocysteine methyltransferase
LYFHGFAVETAEALAEYWHKQVRKELGIAEDDGASAKELFRQKYQGSRYSFGYPACPDLKDQELIFELLDADSEGITLTEEYQIVPEQSTSAIVVHHPRAKYFSV